MTQWKYRVALLVAGLTMAHIFFSGWRRFEVWPLPGSGQPNPSSAGADVLGILIAQIIFAGAAGFAMTMSSSWAHRPEKVADTWRPSLKFVGRAVPSLVLLQAFLGAAYHRDMIGVLPHLLNALVVLMVNLVVSGILIKQYPGNPHLKRPAVALMVVTGAQVLLGFATFIALLISPTISQTLVVMGTIHAMTAALTLGAATVLAVEISGNVSA